MDARILALALLIVPAAARAEDGPVQTGRAAPAPAAAPQDLIAQLERIPDRGSAAYEVPGPPDRKPHGYVTAGIGSGGYRELGGAIVAPLGQNGTIAVEFNTRRFDGRNRRFEPSEGRDRRLERTAPDGTTVQPQYPSTDQPPPGPFQP